MDNFLYNSLLTYFNTLGTLGYVNNKDTYKLIILSTIQELFEEWEYFITEEDYKYLTNALYCLYGSNCILPYPSNLGKNTLSYSLSGGITNPDINGTPGYINPEEGDNSKCYCLNMFERAELLTRNKEVDYNSSVVTEQILKGLPDLIQYQVSDGYWYSTDFTKKQQFQFRTLQYDDKQVYTHSITLHDLVDINTDNPVHLVFNLNNKLPKSVLPLITEGILTTSKTNIYNNETSSSSTNMVFNADSGCPIYIKRNLNAKRLFDLYIGKQYYINDSSGIEYQQETGVPNSLYLLGLTYNALQKQEYLVGCMSENHYKAYNINWHSGVKEYEGKGDPLFSYIPNTCLHTAYINDNNQIVLVIKPISNTWKDIIYDIRGKNNNTDLILNNNLSINYNYNFYINKEKLLKNFKQ